MISVGHASKRYLTRQGWRIILHNINFRMKKGERVGILGRNDADKSTLTRLINGVESPTTDETKRTVGIFQPLALSGAFQGSLTGMNNLRFIRWAYNVNIDYVKNFTREFFELGQYLYEPAKRYSLGMKARLAFALLLAVEFDCHLIDEVIMVDDSCLADECKHELFEERKDHSIALVSYNHNTMKQYCDNVTTLKKGHMYQFEDVDKAYGCYNPLP